MENEPKLPEKKFRAGAISVTIWQNAATNNDGQQTTYNTISLSRTYKDKNNTWQSTSSLRVHDLPKAALLVNKAYEYLVMKEKPQNSSLQSQSSITNTPMGATA